MKNENTLLRQVFGCMFLIGGGAVHQESLGSGRSVDLIFAIIFLLTGLFLVLRDAVAEEIRKEKKKKHL